ncbi:hypothetical protein JCM15457_2416 [Liquorilactobacillus sucicola DSM 21376 = JCM 15457]|nr:hypothetical protein JCM15457_2416 [Liquorilactobacillus sucicola DSM 21376 = JCM 15457]
MLMLTAFTLLLTIKPLNNSLNGLQERIFWKSLKQTWTKEIISSAKFDKVHTIEFKRRKIIFSEKNNNKVVITLPQTMTIRRYEVIRINETGSIAGRTVIVDSTLQDRPYHILVQLGWGKYHVTH